MMRPARAHRRIERHKITNNRNACKHNAAIFHRFLLLLWSIRANYLLPKCTDNDETRTTMHRCWIINE